MTENRSSLRVPFSVSITARLVALDGLWECNCSVGDISETGAKVYVDGPIAELQLKEFFLVFTDRGLVYRRCQLTRMDGKELGIVFVTKDALLKVNRKRAAGDYTLV